MRTGLRACHVEVTAHKSENTKLGPRFIPEENARPNAFITKAGYGQGEGRDFFGAGAVSEGGVSGGKGGSDRSRRCGYRPHNLIGPESGADGGQESQHGV